MNGYIIKDKNVYCVDYEEIDVNIVEEHEHISLNMFGNFYWSYKLYKDPKDAFIDIRNSIEEEYNKIIIQKETLENKLKDIDLKLKEIENDK